MPPGTPPPSTSIDFMEILFWVALAAAIMFAIYHFSKHAGKVTSLAARQGDEEERFAELEVQAALSQTREATDWTRPAAPMGELPPEVARGPQVDPQVAPTERAAPPPAPAPAPGDDPFEALVRKLRALRVIVDKQGDLPLSLPPNGALYSMRRGGTAAVLPRFESEAVLSHYARRYDLVVCPAQDGSVIVMERLEQRLVDLIDDPSGHA